MGKQVRIPAVMVPEIRNRAAQLGVMPEAIIRAALQKWLWQITEDEAAACEDTELYEAWVRKHQADQARAILGRNA